MSVWKLISELDMMAGPIDRPDWDRKGNPWNFKTMQGAAMDGGPANATGDTGQVGVGRGGIGMGGRKDVSGGIRFPSARYTSTWQTDEVHDAGKEEMDRHGQPRNVWKDTPDGENWTEMNNEAMGTPINFTMSNRGGNMMGHNLPGTSRNEPEARKNFIPEDEEMNLKEFFDPSPIEVEAIDNPGQDNLKDQTDDDLENKIDRNYGLESNDDFAQPPPSPLGDEEGEDDIGGMISISSPPTSVGALMDPPKPGGLVPPGGMGGDVVDKASAWDVLQKVVNALGKNLNDGC